MARRLGLLDAQPGALAHRLDHAETVRLDRATHQQLGETEAALRICAEGLSVDGDDAELLFRKAVLHRQTGDSRAAEACWRGVLALKRPERFCSLDPGIFGHLTRRNLANLAQERGDLAEAVRQWREVLVERPGDREAADRLARLSAPAETGWLLPGSTRATVPERGPGDFDPYLELAQAWVEALEARVVVGLGVRAGASTARCSPALRAVNGRVWGVDPAELHNIDDPRFTFVRADAADVADRWERIDLLHVNTDPHTEEQTRRWFDLYAAKCRAIALHDTHHPDFGVGDAVRAFVAAGGWQAFEYRGNASGWTVLTRPGEPSPAPTESAVMSARLERLLFASVHGYLNPSSGAALATRDLLELLTRRGVDCRVLSTGVLDFEAETPLEHALAALGESTARHRHRAFRRRGRRGLRPRRPRGPRHPLAHGVEPFRTRTNARGGGRLPQPLRSSPQPLPAPSRPHLRRPSRQFGVDGARPPQRDRRRLSSP